MSKAQSPVPKKPLPPEAAFITINIPRKTALALFVGFVFVALGVMAFRARQDRLSAAAARGYEAERNQSADTQSATPDDVQQNADLSGSGKQPIADSSQSRWAPAADSDEAYGAEPAPYHPGSSDGSSTESGEALPVVDLRQEEPVRYVASPETSARQADLPPEQPAQPEANDNNDQPPPPTPSPAPDATPLPRYGPVDLNGAGATFPNPIYQKWFSEYHNSHPNVKINYQSIGSGGGIAQVQKGTVDFGATDTPMTNEQLSQTPFRLFHIPTVLGAVVPIYNIPGVSRDLKFSGEVLADVYLGKIRRWNDPRLVNENPGAMLPDREIVVVHRSDSSGTTYIWTDYLSKVSQDWANGPKKGSAINWPNGLGGKGNEGVSGIVKQTEGGIGYVELVFAIQNNMAYGSVRNAAGQFVKARIDTVTAAAASIKDLRADLRVSITNAPGKDAYPISSFTWLLVPQHFADRVKGRDLVEFLRWMVKSGQGFSRALGYAPLPPNVIAKVDDKIAEMR
jgi:phosphate transport system substrate-binding protein